MGKTVRVKVTAKPISNRSVRVKTSVSNGGTTRTKSMTLKNMPLSNNYLNYFQTEEVFENALANGDALAWNFLGIGMLEMLEEAFLSLLPIIGVTALCIIMIKIKGYWMEKNNIFEPETEIGQKDEQEMSTL